jgi:hypothetical protein
MSLIHRLITRKRLLLAGAFGAAGLLIGGIAYAAIPGGDGVIHGCYKTSNPAKGALIAIDSTARCPNGYTGLNWNKTGPQGEQGPQGPQGEQGESGPVTASVVESGQPGRPFVTVDVGSINQITLECPSGTVPVAANWFVNQNGDAGSHGDVSATASGPTIGDKAWTIVLKNSGASAVTVGEHLLCIEGAVQ